MRMYKRIFSLALIVVLVFSSMTVFAANNNKGKGKNSDLKLSDIKWVNEPRIAETKNKKFEVYGKLHIPEGFKGTAIVKLSVNGFNVVPEKDGSFSKSVFITSEVDIKVFSGKEEITNLSRKIPYSEDNNEYKPQISVTFKPRLDTTLPGGIITVNEVKNVVGASKFTMEIIRKDGTVWKNEVMENIPGSITFNIYQDQVKQINILVYNDVSYPNRSLLQKFENIDVKLYGPTTPIIVPIDKSLLTLKINEAKKLVEGQYTPESWNTLKLALNEAELIVAKQNSTQQEIDAAFIKLQNAINLLVKKSIYLGYEMEFGIDDVNLLEPRGWLTVSNVDIKDAIGYTLKFIFDDGTEASSGYTGIGTPIYFAFMNNKIPVRIDAEIYNNSEPRKILHRFIDVYDANEILRVYYETIYNVSDVAEAKKYIISLGDNGLKLGGSGGTGTPATLDVPTVTRPLEFHPNGAIYSFDVDFEYIGVVPKIKPFGSRVDEGRYYTVALRRDKEIDYTFRLKLKVEKGNKVDFIVYEIFVPKQGIPADSTIGTPRIPPKPVVIRLIP